MNADVSSRYVPALALTLLPLLAAAHHSRAEYSAETAEFATEAARRTLERTEW